MASTAPKKKSTIVRAIQSSLKGLAMVHPPSAARTASWLFFRAPPRLPVRMEQEVTLDAATPMLLPHADGPLRGWIWGRPSNATVVLVHGWGGRSAQLSPLVAPLLAAGFRVVALDAPGHGSSPGSSTSIPEIADVLLQLGKQVGPIYATVAHSLGNSAAMLALARGLQVTRHVAIAGPLAPESWFREWVGGVVGSEPAYLAERSRVETLLGTSLAEIHGLELAQGRREPMLWIHDRADRECAFEGGAAVCEAWQGATLVPTEGLGHRRILADGEVHKAVVDFLLANNS